MEEDIWAALLDFYEKVLEPEFRSIQEKLSEHDEKFRQIFDRIARAESKQYFQRKSG